MSDASADSRTPAAFQPRHWIGMTAGAVVYALFVVPQWSRAYIDFGDGNYLYIAARIAEGGALYRDILAPQPPCHLYLGALLIKIAGWIGLSTPLYLIRFFSLVLHLTTFVLVADLARRAWGSAATGLMAGVIFLLLPIGLWWSLGYQSEPLEILFLVLMIHFAIRPPRPGGILGSHGRDVGASLFGALAAFTNATAVPFLLVLILFMLWRNPRRAAWIALPALVVAAILIVAMEVWTGGFFLRTVVFDQVGTFPRDRPLGGYIAGKLLREGGDIFRLEGFFIILALLGFFRFLASSPLPSEERQGLAWFCLATMASFLYVAKGGTVDYIFSLGEPAVALLAAGELKALSQWVFLAVPVRAARPVQSAAAEKLEAPADPSPFALRPTLFVPLKAGALGLIALIAMGPAVNHYRLLWNQMAYELPDLAHAARARDGAVGPNVDQITRWIETHSEPGDEILAPPFYAFLTGRKIWSDYSELLIWRIKDYNDRLDRNLDGAGWTKTRAMASAIDNRQMPIIILELGQTGQLPEVAAALARSYRTLPGLDEPYPTLNTRLGIYLPKED